VLSVLCECSIRSVKSLRCLCLFLCVVAVVARPNALCVCKKMVQNNLSLCPTWHATNMHTVMSLELGSRRGGMNSWFWYEFMVCSMGSQSANIADNQVKIDYTCRSWCWGAVHLRPADKSHGALVGIIARIEDGAHRGCCDVSKKNLDSNQSYGRNS
jgi:hypothetical protein